MTKITPPFADKHHNPDPAYIRELVKRTKLPVAQLSKRMGVTYEAIYSWMRDPETAKGASLCPYLAQYVLEVIASEVE